MNSLREPHTAPDSLMLGVGQAAALLGINPRTLKVWSNDGRIPVSRIGNQGHRRYRLSDIMRIRDASKVPQPDSN